MSGLDDLNFDDVEYDVNSPAWQDPAYRRQMQSSPSRPMAPSGIPMDIATDPDLGFGGQTVAQAMQRAPSVDALDFSDVEPERKPIGMMDFLRNPVGSVSLAVQQQLGRNDPSESIDRTWTEALVTDPATDLRRGTRNVVSGLLGAPVDALNLATAITNPIEAARRVAGGTPLVEQPDVVRGMQAGIAEASEQDIAQNASAKRQAQLAELPAQGGAIDTFGYLATNPSAAGGELLAQVPQLLQFIRGSKWGTIALQSLSAGSQNADQVYQTLLSEGAPPEEAERLASAVANVSTLANAGFTVLPGGGALERGLAGQAGREGARDAGSQVVRSLLGETGAEAGQEASDQAIQNVATGRPVGEGVGAAAALGATVGAPGGALAAVSDVLADRQAPVITPPPAATTAAPVENPLSAAIAEALGAQTAQNAPQGAPSPGAPSVPAQPSAPSPARSGPESGAVIDTRLQNLREAAAGRLESDRVRDLVRERDELEALVREQDALAADNVRGTPQTRLSPEERATADQRRADVRAELEAHRAGQSAQTQLDRLQARLDRIDNDADLARLADELAPVDASVPAGVPSARRQPAGDSGESDAQRQQVQPDEGGAQVREALLAEAPQERAGEARREPRQETAAPAREVAPLAPRVPPAAQVPDTLTLENARAEYDQARTDDERAAAAARIAAVRARDREGVRSVADQGEGSGPAVRPDDSARGRGARERELGASPVAGRAGTRSDGEADGRSPQLRNATTEVTDTNDADIRAALGPAARGISVSASPRDLPDADRNRLGLTEADLDEVEGLYDPDTGRSYVFTGNLGPTMRSLGLSEAQAKVWVAAHERSGHAGLRGMLPDVGALTETLRRANSNPTISALADAIGGGRPERGAALVEEAIAELSAAFVTGDYRTLERKYGVSIPAAQRATVEGYIRRLFDAIRRALGRAGEGMSDTAIYQLVRDANRNAATAPVRGTSSRARAPVAQRAFHGTPHRGIERFSLQNIGTGEGNQVYGWGLYFAGERDVADTYRRGLSAVGRSPGGTIADALLQRHGDRRTVLEVIARMRRAGPTAAERQIGRPALWTSTGDPSVARERMERDLTNAERFLRANNNRGQLYQTDVPEDSELLAWDAPLSEQPAAVRAALRGVSGGSMFRDSMQPFEDTTGSGIYRALTSDLGSERAASEALNESGIPGLRYLDGNSRTQGDGTYNYVIWDESRIDAPQGLIASRAITRTPEFKRWFGDSKVVDEHGNPLVVYHGTAAAFDSFDNSKTGSNDDGLWGRGHYFAASTESASSYALRQGDGARVIPAYVSIKNPLVLKTGRDLVTRLPDGTDQRELIGTNLDGSRIKRIAIAGGHDGVIQIRPNGLIGDVVAYSPEQIKSATGNSGAFDPESPSIIASRPRNTQVDTPGFKRWFGASKVVDDNGKPLVVYHGTTSSFDDFSNEHRGKVTRATSSKAGFFFASTPRTAQSYADHGATITPVEELVARAETAGNRGDWDTHDKLLQEAEALESSLIGDGRARGQNLMPVYLSLQNPLTIDAAGENPEGIGGINKLIAQAKRRGHDGVIIRNFDDAAGLYNEIADHYIAFEPEQIKSATGNSGAFDPSNPSIIASRPVFYSAALRAIEEGRGAPKKGDAAAWSGWLDGAVRRGEMKQGERDWIGIDDWIKENAPVTREQLADFVRANHVQIEETTLGGADEGSFDPDEIDLQTLDETVDDDGSITYDIVDVETGDEFVVNVDEDAGNVHVQGPGGQFIEVYAPMNRQSMADAEFAIREWLIQKHAPKGDEGSDGPTRYGEYQVPGGENYRELLLTIPVAPTTYQPNMRAQQRPDGNWEVVRRDGDLLKAFRTESEANTYVENNAVMGEAPAPQFSSGHFDQTNILAHARFNERTDADGNAVLFVEEIQSDWHQLGRRKGYSPRNPRKVKEIVAEMDDVLLDLRERTGNYAPEDADWESNPDLMERRDALDNEASAARVAERGDGAPDAPLKGTDEWAMLAFKRIARWAVDGGFAKIAWTTGEQQADRYDLSKRVKRIDYMPETGRLIIMGEAGGVVYNEITPEDKLDSVIGKEAAERLLSRPLVDVSTRDGSGAPRWQQLEGNGLKVGGEGMRAFYDNILPKAVNKWAKRFGGRVGMVKLPEFTGSKRADSMSDGELLGALGEPAGGYSVHAIEITDAMRDAVRDGQPVFSRRTPAQARAERQQLLGQLNTSGFPAGPAVPPPPGGKLTPVKDAADWLRVRLQDRMLEVRRAQERAGGENAPGITSVTLADSVNAYRLETLLHGAVRDTVEGGEHKYIRPIQGRLKNVKMSVPTFEGYLLARAAAEINAQVAIVNPAMPDGGSGITTADAAAVLAGTGPNPYTGKPMTATELQQAKAIATLVDGLRDETLQNMVDGHQLPAALAASLKKTYPNYIPTRGKEIPDWMQAFGAGTGRGLSGTKAPIKRRLGRGAGNLPRDILGEMAGDFQKSAVAKGKAKVNQAFLRFAMANPMPDLYEVEPVDLEWKFSKATGEAYLGVKASNDDGRTSMVIMLDGDPIRIRFKDEGIRDAVLNMGPEDMAGVIKTLGAVNRWRSKVLTQYNPAFAPVNMTRDAIFGLTALAAEHGVGVAAQAAAGYLPAMRAMYRQNTKRPGDTNKPISQFDWDDWAREASANGMKTGLTRVDDVKDLQRRMSAGATTLMQLAAEGRPWSLARESVIRAMGPIVETISNANDATENALRLSAYVALRKQGMSAERAAEYAKNMTINFNRKGQWGSALNAFYLFYNASIQGTHAVQRVLRNPKVLTGLIALSSLQGLLLRQMMDDDDNDGITPLDTVPDYVRRTSFVVPLGWATGDQRDYFAIPMPYGFNVFTYTGGRVSQWASLGARPTDESLFADVAKSLMESFSPVPINGDYGSLYGDQLGFAMQLMANRDDEGRPISNLNTNAPYDIPRALQGRTTTPAIYEWAAHSLAKLGGADLKDRIPPVGYLDVSPEQVETVANYFGGGLIRLVNQGLSWKETFNADTFEGGMDAISRTPILSRFIGKGNEARAIADHYYGERGELARKIDVLQDELQGLSDAEVPRAIREAGARDVDLRGLRADRYKTKARKGQIKRTGGGKSGQGRVTLARGEGSTASVMKGADSAVSDYGRQIERIRASDITVQQVVDIGRDNRMTLEDLGLPKEYNGSAVAPNRVKQRAIRFLQRARSERQSGALGVVGWNRENAMSPDDYMGKYWDGQ